MRRTAVLVLAALGASTAVHAGPPTPPCRPIVRDAWVRMTPTMPMGAGYFTLVNPCRAPIVLVGASSDRFESVSMHESRIEQGISRMRPLADVRVDAAGRVDFAPGGRHLMLMSPRGAIAPGTPVRIRLELADGRHLNVAAPVRAP